MSLQLKRHFLRKLFTMTIDIHPSSHVDSAAILEEGVSIGPFCRVGKTVHLEKGVVLTSHIVVDGHTRLGANCQVFPFSVIGTIPQDMKYRGEKSKLIIGRNSIIREHVTINPGTRKGTMQTVIGNDCLLMVGSHVAHDCQIGDHVILVNNATLGGHVIIGEWAMIGGLSAVHQFVRIGAHVMVGGMSGVTHDVIPYASVAGNRCHLSGVNVVGLKRRDFSRDTIHHLRRAYRLLFAQEGTLAERIKDVSSLYGHVDEVKNILNFMREKSPRGLCQPAAMLSSSAS